MASINSSAVLVSGASMAASITGPIVNLNNVAGYAIQFAWSGGATPVGTVSLQVSLDGVNFTALTGATASVSGNSGNAVFTSGNAYYLYVQPIYTFTSGTGSMTITYVGHGSLI